ncbi:LysR substrate-binding domain-containing protein [Plantibacter sp. Mn2098]|uniref:LysR substrate-binding domain-containing protein n=1 Tax=Plantibacter sp. Mn2098 TaxID=3395266 RepID=UPI003BD7EAEA
MPDLDLRKLRYFLVVAEELNYGRAAERLHIAQPVLSRQIAALEHELGVTLFDRSKRGTTMTEVGALLVDDARALLHTASALQRRAKTAGRTEDHLTVGFMPGLMITAAIRELRAQHPDLVVDVVRTGWDTQVELLRDGTLDASFVRLPIAGRGLTVVPLFTEPRVVVLPAGHPMLAQDTVTIDDLGLLDLLQDPDAVPEWRDAAASARPTALSIDRAGLPLAHSVEEKLEHVAGGRGIVILPESTALFYTRPDVDHRHIDDLRHGAVALAFEATNTSPMLAELADIATRLFDRTPVPHR